MLSADLSTAARTVRAWLRHGEATTADLTALERVLAAAVLDARALEAAGTPAACAAPAAFDLAAWLAARGTRLGSDPQACAKSRTRFHRS